MHRFIFTALLSALLFHNNDLLAQQIPPLSGTRIVVISDFNSSYGSTDYSRHVDSVIARIPGWNPDLVLSAGDLIAGQRLSLTDQNMLEMWDVFSRRILLPLTSNGVPFGFTLGNHDASSFPAYERDRRFASDFWLDTAHDPLLDFHDRSHFPFYFSFVHNDLFLVSWYASSSVIGEDQKNWLQDQLASQQARDASMRILVGHLPVHAVADGRNRRGENLDNPDGLMQLLEELGIDLYVCGHHHAFYPAVKNGIRFIHAGAIGDGPRPLIGSTLEPRNAFTIIDLEKRDHSQSLPSDLLRSDATGTEPSRYLIRRSSFNPENWSAISEDELPRYIRGVNGHITRDGLHPRSEYTGVLSAFNTRATTPDALTGEAGYRATFVNGVLHVTVNYDGFGSAVTGISLRMGTPAENGRILARTIRAVVEGHPNISGSGYRATGAVSSGPLQHSGTFELTHTPGIADSEALAAGLLYIALETVGSPNGAVRAHLYPSGWSCDANGFGSQGAPIMEHTGSGFDLAWNRVHPLTAEPVFYSVDVAADSAFTSFIDRIPAGTGLRLL
ncbi:MAG: metallophosphoesterase, partial [Rhodothermaceae bacterium]|nr:metallophosphoesterase [Rhodothermaceae bacterium]